MTKVGNTTRFPTLLQNHIWAVFRTARTRTRVRGTRPMWAIGRHVQILVKKLAFAVVERASEENVGGLMGIWPSQTANVPADAVPLFFKPTGFLQEPAGSVDVISVWLIHNMSFLDQLHVVRAISQHFPESFFLWEEPFKLILPPVGLSSDRITEQVQQANNWVHRGPRVLSSVVRAGRLGADQAVGRV